MADEMMVLSKEDDWMAEDEVMISKQTADTKLKGFIDPEVQNAVAHISETRRRHFVHVRSEPVVEILSVTLRNNSMYANANRSREIYGNIFVVDTKSDTKCSIYELNEQDDEPELIPFDGATLSLTGPDDATSMDKPGIIIDIFDRVAGETIINDFKPLIKTVDKGTQHHQFEQVNKLVVDGSDCFVEVEYLSLTFGIFAPIYVQIIKQQVVGCGNNKLKEDEDDKGFMIYGTVSASYNLLCSESKVNHIVLFDIKEDSDEYDWVTLGCDLTLSRSVVAVPAYSSLTIQVELWDRVTKKLIVQGSTNVESDNYRDRAIITGLNCLNAEVIIDWEKPFKLNDPAAKKKILWGLYSHFWAPHAVEVFSVFIGHKFGRPLRLHGMIAFAGGRGDYQLFKRGKDDPFILYPGRNLLPLKGPNKTLIPGDSFSIIVDLEDVDGHLSIKGIASASYGLNNQESGWFNRLLCSVVKGEDENGFAAIHYTVIAYAIQATLKIHFFKGEQSSNDSCKIYGSLVALYDEYGCTSSYEKLYYQNVVFERPKENPLEVPCTDFDMEMELSKYVFAVPHNSCLRIVVDLTCQFLGFTGFLKETGQFQVNSSDFNDVVIEGDGFGVNMSVKWSQA